MFVRKSGEESGVILSKHTLTEIATYGEPGVTGQLEKTTPQLER